ncbi:hypothetical protein [Tenuibacillus multivorans]|uniref:Uncharacterized protein n=1 Tax=Tenuibacillus multivorans TaxID=237069 RepID=A0A1H0DZQ3_9BACI|nr:hypothetical protein [Tenuibacillus multivorans]GEL76718.1 hypothetical protein TMU01_09530 [Tenuibacillus multivorans]SDN75471.1 hypothetical protein SAMN05216498_3002 [Tenuibacillus multivorans]
MDTIINFQWEIFIVIEIISLISLLLFGVTRYYFDQKKLSRIFILVFLLLLALEAVLAVLIYQSTGEISTFQIVLIIFVLYAVTFGIYDFFKLDRWMRRKIGNWRGMELLTEKDYRVIERNKDPKHVAKVYRNSATIHLIVFVLVQSVFWMIGTDSVEEMFGYLTSWFETGKYEDSPYPNDTLYSIGMLWMIVFVVDFIYSWSYTIFPSK